MYPRILGLHTTSCTRPTNIAQIKTPMKIFYQAVGNFRLYAVQIAEWVENVESPEF